jgi:hypothetical protein
MVHGPWAGGSSWKERRQDARLLATSKAMKRAAQSPAKRRKAKLADTPEDKAVFRAIRAIRVGGPRPRFDLSNPASLRGALWYELEKVFDDRTPAARKNDQEFARWLERDRRRRKRDTSQTRKRLRRAGR